MILLIPVRKAMSLTSFSTTVNSIGVWIHQMQRFELVRLTLDMKAHVLPKLALNRYTGVCTFEDSGGDPLP